MGALRKEVEKIMGLFGQDEFVEKTYAELLDEN